MGRPIELGTPRAADANESTSDEEGWVTEESDDEQAGEWRDPTGGALTAVFEAAEAGDVDDLQDALGRLDVSIDTRVRRTGYSGHAATGKGWNGTGQGVQKPRQGACRLCYAVCSPAYVTAVPLMPTCATRH